MQTISITQQLIPGKSEVMLHATWTHPFRSVPRNLAWRRLAGFTLIELMIVVTIVAILSAIAIPAYQRQIMQSRRTSAKTALLDVASREEKFYSANNYYPASLASVGYSTVDGTGALQVPNNTNEDYYSVTIAVTAATGTTPAAFTATATGTTASNQSSDSCGNYSVTDLGVQSATGTNSGNGSGCW